MSYDKMQQFDITFKKKKEKHIKTLVVLQVALIQNTICVATLGNTGKSYEEILDISLFFTLILTFSCCSLSMANTGDEVIYLHYFDFVNFYKKV